MKTRFIQSIFFLIVGISLVSFHDAHAQLFTSDGTAQTILVNVTPDNPGALQTVSFKATSFLSNLDQASISWYVNGAKVASGTGLREFSTRLGDIGTNTTVKVIVVTKEGNTISQSFSYRGAQVDLILEANTYTPPFYQGKALLTPHASGRIVAIPHFTKSSSTITPTDYIYTWTQDGRPVGNASGYGKNVFFLNADTTGKPSNVSVVVSSKDGLLKAQGFIKIQVDSPKLLSYINMPGFGTLFNIALTGNISMKQREVNIAAVPYFFATTESTVPYVRYNWTMNDSPVEETSNMLTVRNEATSTGTTNISATASVTSGGETESDTTSFSMTF